MSKFRKIFNDKMKELESIKEFYEVQDVYEDEEEDTGDEDPGFEEFDDNEDPYEFADKEGGLIVPIDDDAEEFEDEEFEDGEEDEEDEEVEDEEITEEDEEVEDEEITEEDEEVEEIEDEEVNKPGSGFMVPLETEDGEELEEKFKFKGPTKKAIADHKKEKETEKSSNK